ncbi:MAG: tRNA 2-thiocytidine biosynthesis protein TtcA [Firmicutes bacterium]|nr:tRNA 2-thiocytidine biosynthesis protein TtcA [Bacillota bacterium]
MRLSLPKKYNQKILRACREFELIAPGDRILVGFSGGKDSAFLLFALALLVKYGVLPVELAAVTIDLGFEPPLDPRPLQQFCDQLGVEFTYLSTQIARVVEEEKEHCAYCAHLRRGRMNRFAAEQGFNKLALAHHHDDAVETFLMSIIYSGQIRTFLPKTYLDRSQVTVIRPLAYLREQEIVAALPYVPYQPAANNCPFAGLTYRQKVKELIAELTAENEWVYPNLAKAMRAGRPVELWPPEWERGRD